MLFRFFHVPDEAWTGNRPVAVDDEVHLLPFGVQSSNTLSFVVLHARDTLTHHRKHGFPTGLEIKGDHASVAVRAFHL